MGVSPISRRAVELLSEIRDSLQGAGDNPGTVELGADTIAAIQQAVDDANNAVETTLSTVANTLNDILAELLQKLEAGEDIGLTEDAITELATAIATLMAFPVDYPDATAHAQLTTVTMDDDQDAFRTAPARKEVIYTAQGATPTAAIDVSNFRYVSVQLLASNSAVPQISNDGTNWINAPFVRSDSTSGAYNTGSFGSAAIFMVPLPARYFRINNSSGTYTAILEFFASAPWHFGSVLNSVSSVSQSGTWNVRQTGSTGTVAAVATGTTVATLQASASTRTKIIIVNDSASDLYIKYGNAASSTDYTVKLGPGLTWTEDRYFGIVTGTLASGSGTARVTQVG